jgi:hypothetical protein
MSSQSSEVCTATSDHFYDLVTGHYGRLLSSSMVETEQCLLHLLLTQQCAACAKQERCPDMGSFAHPFARRGTLPFSSASGSKISLQTSIFVGVHGEQFNESLCDR